MAVTTNTYAIQKVFTIRAFDLVTGECLGQFKDLKDSNLSVNSELVYAQGGVGNPKIVGFGHSKTAMLTANNALVDFGTAGIILGSTPVVGTNTNLTITDVLTVTTNAATTTYTALGTAGTEIKFAYLKNADGTLGTKFTQAATPSTGKFSYTVGTKALAFFAGDVTSGAEVVVFYKATAGATTRTIADKINVFAKQVKVVADTLVTNTCDGTEYGAQLVIHKAQTSNNMELALSADGAPTVQNVEFDALKSCTSNNLFDLIVFDSTETV